MSISDNINRVRIEYSKYVFELLKKQSDEKIWALMELAHHRGYTCSHQLLSGLQSVETFVDIKGQFATFFDFVSPVEACLLLSGKNKMKGSDPDPVGATKFYVNGQPEYLPKLDQPQHDYHVPTDEHFFIGSLDEEKDPQVVHVSETASTQADYEKIANRRNAWRGCCRGVFETVWASSKAWGFALEEALNNVSDFAFSDSGIDFISDVIVKAKSRGFVYDRYYIAEMNGQKDTELSDEFSQAVMLFVSPAEIYEMLDITLVMAVGKYAKPYDPRRIKMVK